MKEIWLDMDGTFVDLYSETDWLEKLKKEDTSPYSNAKPLVNLSMLARLLNKAQAKGYKIGIISWTSKSGTQEFQQRIVKAKTKWLKVHIPSVHWDKINIIPYGTPKHCYSNNDGSAILFDDEERNRNSWIGSAYEETQLFNKLNELIK